MRFLFQPNEPLKSDLDLNTSELSWMLPRRSFINIFPQSWSSVISLIRLGHA